MRTRNIVRLILITIIVLIALSISTVSNAAVESNQYKITRQERKELHIRNIPKYKSRRVQGKHYSN